MRIHILGSSAGKTIPRPFCRCRVCEHAKIHRGPNMRTRTGIQIFTDEEEGTEASCHVDMSPDTGHHMMRDGFNLARLEHLLITHPDEDHFAPMYIRHRRTILSSYEDMPPLNVYGNHETGMALTASAPDLLKVGIVFHKILPFRPFNAGWMDVFPIAASHTPGALNYIIRAEGKCVLLAWDTGWWPDETWEALNAERPKFNAVLMECTHLGPITRPMRSHLDFNTMIQMREGLLELGCIKSDTPFVLMHIGDNGGLTHDESVEMAARQRVTVSYDGFEMKV